LARPVQFQVRDAVSADKDLRLAVERAAAEAPGRRVGALLFTCNARGRRMFGVADHDASAISHLLGGIPLAGFFAAGEDRADRGPECAAWVYGVDGAVCGVRRGGRHVCHFSHRSQPDMRNARLVATFQRQKTD
jgi:hypothetical protein